jgi:hypothetical protein
MDLWRIEIEDHAREVSGWKGSSDEFSHLFHVAATQRLLQACGAYGFLGRQERPPGIPRAPAARPAQPDDRRLPLREATHRQAGGRARGEPAKVSR